MRKNSLGKNIVNCDLFKKLYIIGLAAVVAKNAVSGKKIIDIENIKKRISKVDGTNPLIFVGLGLLAKNPALTAIGMYAVVDPPDEKKEEYIGYSNIGENEESTGYSNIREGQESTGYSNIGETEEKSKKRFVY